MKSLKLLIAYVVILCASLAHGQSVTPGFQDPINGGWMHSFLPMSGLFKGNLNLGSLSGVVRTVEVKPQTDPGDAWVPLNGLLAYITTSGVDQFNVSVAGLVGNYSWFDVRITYTSGPNGWTQVIIINNVRSRQTPQLQIGDNNNGFYCIGYTLYVPVFATNYASGEQNYDSRVVLEYESTPGVWTYYDHYDQNGAIGNLDGETFEVFLPGPPAMPSPLLCFRLKLEMRHQHQAGYSDIGWTVIAQTSGNNCYEWSGLSTSVDDGPDGPKPCCMKPYPNPATPETGWTVTIDGNFDQSLGFQIYGPNGQLVRDIPAPQSSIFTMDVSDFASGAYMVRQGGDRACTIIVRH